jgi:hypothetical protein
VSLLNREEYRDLPVIGVVYKVVQLDNQAVEKTGRRTVGKSLLDEIN